MICSFLGYSLSLPRAEGDFNAQNNRRAHPQE
jgi:hypothetical protein